MTSFRVLHVLLFLLLHQVYSEEPEPVFKAEGSVVEMGYCFGVDYIVVYRAAPEGDQLLGNSSMDSTPITLPADLQGRIRINRNHQLLGLQISDLTHLDSGLYRRECWQDHTLINQHTQQLSVCDEEIESKEIIMREGNGGAELLCNSTFMAIKETSVRWYYETHPSYRPTLFLDSSVSLNPLVKDLQGAVKVEQRGELLLLNNSVLLNNQHFYCLVIKGEKCLRFQNMYMPDNSESTDIFASFGDRVVLPCTSDGNNQQWDTPQGMISSSKTKDMFISSDVTTSDYSLIIYAVSEEHSGDYSCISSSREIQYTLVLCPKKESKGKSVYEGSKVSLECDAGLEEPHVVQWYRRGTSGVHELIYDSGDDTVAIPEDLKGKLAQSHSGSSLTLSNLTKTDEGPYWCVILRDAEVFVGDDDYEEYDEEETEETESSDVVHWQDEEHRCLFKQETVLSLMPYSTLTTSMPNGTEPSSRDGPQIDTTSLGVGLAALVLLAVIAIVIVIKMRAKAHPQQNQGVNMNAEPGCTESLTQNDEFRA